MLIQYKVLYYVNNNQNPQEDEFESAVNESTRCDGTARRGSM